jgi:transposase
MIYPYGESGQINCNQGNKMTKGLKKQIIGIDIASETFSACYRNEIEILAEKDDFLNTSNGYFEFLDWLVSKKCNPEKSVFCIENTGSYSLGLANFLYSHNFTVWIEDSNKILRAINKTKGKTDRFDAQYIAEYALRFQDKIVKWQPSNSLCNEVQVLLTIRSNYVKSKKRN